MYFDTSDICGPSHCIRWKCAHKKEAVKWPRPPAMPPCKPAKRCNIIVSDDNPLKGIQVEVHI